MAYENKKIAAIVVTYNRRSLLEKCLSGLELQESLDSIIIINNGSSDDTQTFLNNYDSSKELHVVNLKENTGGAGGFHEGIKLSASLGFAYSWIMDDDACALDSALEKLLIAINLLNGEFGFLASNVISETGEAMNTPVIDLRLSDNGYQSWTKHVDKGLVKIRMATFVSILIKNELIQILGLPVKEMFIWGDDSEYTQRISNIAEGYLVGNSVVVHRRQTAGALNIIYETNQDRLKMYYRVYRNSLYRIIKHENFGSLIKYILAGFLEIGKIILQSPNNIPERIWQVVKGYGVGYYFFWKLRNKY